VADRILIIEDQADIGSALAEHLRIEGFTVDVALTGEAGLDSAVSETPDLVILDLMLPGVSGETVLRTLRSDGVTAPVLILSARHEEVDKVHGFRLGADDYVTKPFGLLELLARVHALLRRAAERRSALASRATQIVFDRFVFDVSGHRVTRDGVELQMRPKERDLLFALVEHAGRTVSRDRLLKEVWGYAKGVDSRTIDWHIAELRRKLSGDESQTTLIRTIRKVGYLLTFES